jgi:Icc-related predicted phosphoesterase
MPRSTARRGAARRGDPIRKQTLRRGARRLLERGDKEAAMKRSASPDGEAGGVVRVAALGDLHCTKELHGKLQPLLARAAQAADVLLLCGDLTDYGLPDEAHVLARELTAVHVPMIGVLGNHDFESGKQAEVSAILAEAGVKMLDGDACEVEGVGFAGVKGFAGGFGRGALGPWGENAIKDFVREAVNEALKLESALARLRTPHRIGVLHYAPVADTVVGEPPEISPWLGSGRLSEPLYRYKATAVFHGHAHRGAPEGKIGDAIPVYNVALPLLQRHFPDGPPCRVIEVAVAKQPGGPPADLISPPRT